jgi:sugar phosphate isomerase/epimerase
MEPLQIIPSTTSHKRERLIPTLRLFARLGFRDIDLNLNHIVEGGADPGEIGAALAENGQRVQIASGGWCDFFEGGPAAERTQESVERQVALARRLGADRLRLFFGRLPVEAYAPASAEGCARNIGRVAERHPDLLFVFENHDGASSRPHVCRTVLEAVGRPNVRLTFDPINFEHRGVRTADALAMLRPFIGHVHLKGYAAGEFCGFGEGIVDLTPALRTLVGTGYAGGFTVEYEGTGDRTLRLFESVERACGVLAHITGMGAVTSTQLEQR